MSVDMYNTFGKKREYVFQKAILTLSNASSLISTYEKQKSDLQKNIQISKQINVQNYNNRLTDIQTVRQTDKTIHDRQTNRPTNRQTYKNCLPTIL